MFEYINIGNIFRDWRINPIIVQLTDYGTVFINSDEYNFEDFEKALNHNYHSYIKDFFYHGLFECFKIDYRNSQGSIKSFEINITKKQKELIRNGLKNDNTDNSIQRLMQIADRKRRDKKKELIDSRIQKTGELPSSNEEIILYAEYLEEQLARKKAEIAKLCRRLSFASSLFIPSVFAYVTENNEISIAAMLGVMASAGLFYIYHAADEGPAELIQSIKDANILYNKLLLLKERVQELALEEKKTPASLPEAPKVKVYKNEKYS